MLRSGLTTHWRRKSDLVIGLTRLYCAMMTEETKSAQATPEKKPFRLRKYLKFPRTFAEVKRMGWKFILAFVLFYLIRDSILYLLIPYLIYKGVIGG